MEPTDTTIRNGMNSVLCLPDCMPEYPIQLGENWTKSFLHYGRFAPDGTLLHLSKVDRNIQQAIEELLLYLQYNRVVDEYFVSQLNFDQRFCFDCPRPECEEQNCKHRQRAANNYFGGIACGTIPVGYLTDFTGYLEELDLMTEYNNLFFEDHGNFDGDEVDFLREKGHIVGEITVRLSIKGTLLLFERTPKQREVPLRVKDDKTMIIDHDEVKLRPWSMALYRLFAAHPEGLLLNQIYTDYKKEFVGFYHEATRSDLKLEKLQKLLAQADVQRTVNDKLSELNIQLDKAFVAEIYQVHSEKTKSNNKPYFIRHLHNHLIGSQK